MITVSACVVLRVACAPFASLAEFAAPEAMVAERAFARADAAWQDARAALERVLHELAGSPGEGAEVTRRRFAVLALRRALHRGIVPDPKRLEALACGPNAAGLAARVASTGAARTVKLAKLENALVRADQAAAEALGVRIRDPAFAEGLFLAGGDALLAPARRLAARPYEKWRAHDRQVAATTLRYAVRAATKTSPQGVFCATTLAGWEERLRLSGNAGPARVLGRINVAEARKLTAAHERALASREDSRIGINPSLLVRQDAMEFWSANGPGEAHEASLDRHLKLRSSPPLRAVIDWIESHGGDRAIDRASLLSWVAPRAGADASAWLDQLLAFGLLVLRSGIPHDETRPLRRVAHVRGASAAAFEDAEVLMDALSEAPDPEGRIAIYRATQSLLGALPAAAPLDRDGLLRVDAEAGVSAALPRACAREIARVLPCYARFFGALYPRALLLDPYVRRFRARHPAERAVPLVDLYHGVFDALGTGARTAFPEPGRVAPGAPEPWASNARAARARWQAFLAERFRAAEATGGSEIEIADSDWDDLAGDAPPPHFACGLLFQTSGSRLIWNGIYGAGLAAARLAGLHAGDAAPSAGPLAQELRDGWRWLAPPGSVIAEIPYRHSGRTANAGLKPRVFEHEIELPGEVPSPGAVPIPLNDLDARFEQASGRFVLTSRRLGREVVPVLTNGLSPEGFTAFLAAVGQQDAQPLAHFAECPPDHPGHAPQVVSGDTVLYRRRWRLEPAEAARLLESGASAAERFSLVQRWREAWQVPRYVFAASERSAKPFHVDLDAPWSIELLRPLARDGSGVTVRVMSPVPVGDGLAGHAIESLAHVRATAVAGLTFAGPAATMPA
jgi:hypothetical protein